MNAIRSASRSPFLLPLLLVACGDSHAGSSAAAAAPDAAVCVLRPVGDGSVHGLVHLRADGDSVHVTGEVRGLEPGKHGFHVHRFGDVRGAEDGASAGGHFAPHGHDHGAPDAAVRHVGDLGNLVAGPDGVAAIDVRDATIALHGENSVVGRAFVVHAGEDTFTPPSGGAGARVALGVIGIAAK
ncbi:MAG: superoxide dismutase family protein [Planctomycetota bacterium]